MGIYADGHSATTVGYREACVPLLLAGGQSHEVTDDGTVAMQ